METTNTTNTPPDNNLVWGILCTVLCCIPLGIVSILKSNKVQSLWVQGDHIGAQKAADDAKKYAIWGAIIGPILIVLCWVMFFIIGLGSAFLGDF